MRYLEGFFMSFSMFCALPCPYRPWNERAKDLMLVFLPGVGLIQGLLWFGIYLILNGLSLPIPLKAAVLMLYPFLVTGFIHLDGFMDTNDALLSRRPLEEKLRILKDPHAGAFAVISLGILFVVSFSGMLGIMESLKGLRHPVMLCLIWMPVISRCCSAFFILWGKPLGHSQYRRGEVERRNRKKIYAVLLMGIFCMTAGALLGVTSTAFSVDILIILTSIILSYLIAMITSMKEMGGVSGDLAGYALTIAEACGIVVLSILIQ